jgi:hypothetical protein
MRVAMFQQLSTVAAAASRSATPAATNHARPCRRAAANQDRAARRAFAAASSKVALLETGAALLTTAFGGPGISVANPGW